jgi:hypothetical protein
MRRCALTAVVVAFALAAPAAQAETEGGGTLVGGSVSSTLSLDLTETAAAGAGATVRAVVSTTEPDSMLSAAPADGRTGLSATVSGPYAPIDPAFGLTLMAWDDVLAGKTTTLRLKAPAPSTVVITLSPATP